MNLQRQLARSFYEQRDLPFSIPDCLCADKHIALKATCDNFKDKGLEARYRVVGFDWDDLPLDKTVLAVPHKNEDEHVYLEVKLGGNWYAVDATWDQPLSIARFKVNSWNNLSKDMANAVAVEPTRLFSPEESHESVTADLAGGNEISAEEFDENGAFYDAVNKFLESTREEYQRWRHAPRRLFYYLDKSL